MSLLRIGWRLTVIGGLVALFWTVHSSRLWGAVAVALLLAIMLLSAAAVVRGTLRRRVERRRLHGFSLGDLDAMTGDAFEDWVVRSLVRSGFRCENLPRSHDYGIDVIATRRGRRVGVQAKRYDGPVGNGAVQQAIAGAGHHACAVAAVVTQSRFTAAARAQAAAAILPVVLVDRGGLPDLSRVLDRC
jgi:restriction system protein